MEAIVALVAGVPAALAAIAAGSQAVWRVAIVDRIKAADDALAAAHRRETAALAERDQFKADWKEAVAAGRELRRRYERALGLPVSDVPPAPRDVQATLVGYELHRDDAAFLAALAAQEREREIPTRRDNQTPQPFRGPDPEKTPRTKSYGAIRVDDARRARDPSGPRGANWKKPGR